MKIKNIILTASFFLVSALVACTNDNEGVGETKDSLSIYAEMGMESRTMLGADAETVTWYEGDRIYIFDKDGASKGTFTLKNGAGQKTATFNGNIDGQLSALDKSLYPVPTIENNEFSFEFPSVREYTENSAAPMIGDFSATEKHVNFRNLAALVRVSLVGQDVQEKNSLTLTMNGQTITGKAVVDLDNETLTMVDGGKTLTINNIPAGTSYVDVPVPAGSYTGYSVKLNGLVLKSSDQAGELNKDDALVIGQLASVEYVAFSKDILDSEDVDIDYAILGSNGQGYLYEFQEENPQLPKRMAIWDGTKPVEEEESVKLEVNFNEQGLPTNIITNDMTIVLSNHSGNAFDAFIVLTSGESAIFEDLELQDNMTWESYLVELNNPEQSRAVSRNPRLRPINVALNGVGCAISVAAAIVGTPTAIGTAVGWGLAAMSCGSALATIANEMQWIDTSSVPGNIIASFAAIGSCINPSNPLAWTSCAVGALGAITGWLDQFLNDRQDDIQLGNGALVSGNGDVKITLTWNKTSDIDLHCKTPEGAHIYFGNRHPQGTNGWLDFDNIPGFPDCTDPENIFFEPAAAGQYDVYLHYYSDNNNNGPVNYRVVIFINGVGEVFEGTINHVNDIVPIKTFVMGAASRAAVPFRAITWDWNNLPAKN